jgi:hypothetical protein
MTEYLVFINAPPYPSKGYYIGVKRTSKDWAKFVDTLPPTLVDHVIVISDNPRDAQAIGLRQLFERARAEGKPLDD